MKLVGIWGLLILVSGCIVSSISATTSSQEFKTVRKSAVAGMFYPGDPEELRQVIAHLLDSVPQSTSCKDELIGLVSPHAGYPYSGPVAAYGYAELRNRSFERVIVISPSHIDSFKGAAVYSGDGYETPLGIIPVDVEFSKALTSRNRLIHYSDKGHRTRFGARGEHALEVQLPFLQFVLKDFKLVPIIMGEQSIETCRSLAAAIVDQFDDQRTLIVASSDLSHFHNYEQAVAKDHQVTNAIERWDYLGLSRNLTTRSWEACGGGPIVTTMIAAEKLGASDSRILKYANSGDVPFGDKSRVVGYTSAAFFKSDQPSDEELYTIHLSDKDQKELFRIVRLVVRSVCEKGRFPDIKPPGSPSLMEDAAVFVTLKKHGHLRGCVGSVFASESLYQSVATSAANAALNDRRFTPVSVEELEDLEYEISILSPFRLISDVSKVEVGKHGLLLEKGRNRGLLLPQVATDNQWNRETFLEHTCLKAGLPADAWKDPAVDIYIFSATVMGEKRQPKD